MQNASVLNGTTTKVRHAEKQCLKRHYTQTQTETLATAKDLNLAEIVNTAVLVNIHRNMRRTYRKLMQPVPLGGAIQVKVSLWRGLRLV